MRVRFFSLGCKVNQYEMHALAGLFDREGFLTVQSGDADVLVVNSCTVTAEADRKTRQLVRRLRREHPQAVIALTGCFAQVSPEAAFLLKEADIVAGTAERAALPSLVRARFSTGERQLSVGQFSVDEAFEALPGDFQSVAENAQRAFLKVEDGCARFCAYCIIPAAAGPCLADAGENRRTGRGAGRARLWGNCACGHQPVALRD
jgi:threonylcarbamoyladenosine tRNA methylthiotransferase MtaB